MAVTLVTSEPLVALSDLVHANLDRSSLVFELIRAYGLDQQCENLTVKPATRADLLKFHSEELVEQLLKKRKHLREPLSEKQRVRIINSGLTPPLNQDENHDGYPEDLHDEKEILQSCGLMYDNPIFPLMDQYCLFLAGSTISSARHLIQQDPNTSPIVINWHGGRHHGKKSTASGFCYINDIVLGILELRKKYEKIVYVDFDLHHGDGVEAAFKFSDKVCTISLHRREFAFFPGTGDLKDQGLGKGKGYAFNIPTMHGLSDLSLSKIVERCVLPVIEKFGAECVVVQCGADGLAGDEHAEWNLSIKGLGDSVKKILGLKKLTMLLGGGGYNHSQVARCWTYLSDIAIGAETKFDLLPDEFIESHPEESYEFWDVPPRKMNDENTDDYIDSIANAFKSRMELWK